MIRLGKRFSAALCSLIMLVVCCVPCSAENGFYTNAELEEVMREIISWKSGGDEIFSESFCSGAGTSQCDWYALSAARIGVESEGASLYLKKLEENISQRYSQENGLGGKKATEWHRTSLTILALGGDPTAFGTNANGEPIDLIADGIYDRSTDSPLNAQGVNGSIWGLITLDSGSYEIPQDAAVSRDSIISDILNAQLDDGSFSLDGSQGSIDITAMAIQSLSPYYLEKRGCSYTDEVKTAVDNALEYLSQNQQEDGDFCAYGDSNLESTAQVACALCALGISPESYDKMTKNGSTVLDGIMKYRCENGGFSHIYGEKADSMASEQALYSLCAIYRCRNSLSGLFDMQDGAADIFELCGQKSGVYFTQTDVSLFEKLPDSPEYDDFSSAESLYLKLLASENAEQYSDILPALKEKFENAQQIKNEVDDINGEIAESFYPPESVSLKNSGELDKIIERGEKLSENDRGKLLKWQELLQRQRSLQGFKTIIFISSGALVTAAVIFIIIRKKRCRNEN